MPVKWVGEYKPSLR